MLVGRAYHGAASNRIGLAPGLEFAAGGFYRTYTNLFVQEWTSLGRFSTSLQPADGRSYGGSLRIEFERGPVYGFLNYGYSNTRYSARARQFGLWYGTEDLSFRPPHDQRHQVNAVFGFARRGYELNVRWSGATGRPYGQPLGFDGFVYMNEVKNQFRTDSERRMSTMRARARRSSTAPGMPPLLLLAGIFLTGALLSGCETSVELPEEPPRAFTLWGSLNPREDTQTVKIFSLGARLERITEDDLPATVTSENLETGRVRTWRDSLVREVDGEARPFAPDPVKAEDVKVSVRLTAPVHTWCSRE